MEKLGEIIRIYRKEKKLKGFQFAKKLGIHPTYVTLIERYNKIPAPSLIRKIEKVLGIDLKDMYIKETIPSDFLQKFDFYIPTPSGPLVGNFKHAKADKHSKEQVLNNILYFTFHYKDTDATKAALSVINKVNPSKAGDKRLEDDLATTIRTLRRVFPALISQNSDHVK